MNEAEILTEEILLSRDESIMTEEIEAAKDGSADLGDEMHNDITDGQAKETQEKKPDAENEAGEAEKNKKEAKQTKFEKRIGRMTKKQRDTERELESTRQQLREAQEKIESKGKPEVMAEPVEDDFESYSDYNKALIKHAIDNQEAGKAEARAEVKQEEEKQGDMLPEAIGNAVDDVLLDGAEKFDDFDTVVRNPDVNFTNEILGEIVEADAPDDLLYYLAKNPSEVDRLNDLNPKAMAREIAKMEVQLESGKISFESNSGLEKTISETDTKSETEENHKKAVTNKRITKAPEPITPIDGKSKQAEKPISKMTTAEFRDHRMKQMKQRRGR